METGAHSRPAELQVPPNPQGVPGSSIPHPQHAPVQRSVSERTLATNSPATNRASFPRALQHQQSEPQFKINSPHDSQDESPRHNKWGVQVLLSASPSILHPGEKLTLVWGVTDGSPDYYDWIGMFRVGEDNKQCLLHHYCGREKRGGTWHPTAPQQPGEYEFRFMKSAGVWPSAAASSINKSNLWTVTESVLHNVADSTGYEVVSVEGNPPHLDLNQRINTAVDSDADQGPASGGREAAHAQPSPGSQGGQGVFSALSQLLSPHVHGISAAVSPPTSGDGERAGLSGAEAGERPTRVCGPGLGGSPSHNLLHWFSKMGQRDEGVQIRVEFDAQGRLVGIDDQLAEVLQSVSLFLLSATEDPRGRRALLEKRGFNVLLHLCMDDNLPAVQAYACKALMNLADDAGKVLEDMNVEENRLRSFAYGWPHSGTPLTPQVMAAAGFYFAPRPDQFDRTVCFQCKTAMMAWDADEDPAVEHRRVFAACQFLTDPASTSNAPLRDRAAAAQLDDSPVRPAQHGAALFQLIREDSPASDLLQLPEFEEALMALQRSGDIDVQRLGMQLLAQLSTSTGDKDKFAETCLPRLFDTLEDSRDSVVLVYACQALAHLASQPICRDRILTSPRGADAVRLLISALPKWCSPKVDHSAALIVNCLQALSYIAQSAKEQVAEAGGTQAILLVLRERNVEETEVMRWAVAALRHLAILRITHPALQSDVRRLVAVVTDATDLHVQADAGRVLATLADADPAVFFQVAVEGLPLPTAGGAEIDPGLGGGIDPQDPPSDKVRRAVSEHPAGLTALRFLARRSTSRDVVCQRFAAQAVWCMARSVLPPPELYRTLIAVGFDPAVAELGLRLSGERHRDLVIWLSAAAELKTQLEAGQLDATDGVGFDLQRLLLQNDGLEIVCGLLQQEDREVRLWGLRALAEVTRRVEHCGQTIEYKALESILAIYKEAPPANAEGEEQEAAAEAQGTVLEVLANVSASADCLPHLLFHGVTRIFAAAAKAKDVRWQRQAARGLALLSGHESHGIAAPPHPGLDWIPCAADSAGDAVFGLSALLSLSHSAATSVQAWAAQGLLNACEDGVKAGWPDAMIHITSERRVHSIMHLVYSSSPWVARTAMQTLAALSTLQRESPLGDGKDALMDARRALFLTGVMFPTIKIGMVGDLDETRAAAIIVSNLASDPRNVADMVNGSDSTLLFTFHIASFHIGTPSAPQGRKTAHRTSPLTGLIQYLSPVRDQPESFIKQELCLIRRCGLQTIKTICHNHSFHTRFVERGGVELLVNSADWVCPPSDPASCVDTASALLIAQAIEGLASNRAMHELLAEKSIKAIVKRFFKVNIQGIDEAAEHALVALNAIADPTTERRPRGASDCTAEDMEPEATTSWKIKTMRPKDTSDKRVFKMPSEFTYDDLYNKLLDIYRERLSVAYEDEDSEWIVLGDNDDLQEAKSGHSDPVKRKLRLRITLDSESRGREANAGKEAGKEAGEHRHAEGGGGGGGTEEGGAMEKTLMESHLTDSNRSEQEGGGLLRWQLGRCIGRGAFAEVYQGINADTGELMAVKQVTIGGQGDDLDERRQEAARTLQREIDIMRQLQHKHIVKYLGTEQTGGRLNIFLEYVSGGSIAALLQHFGALDEPVVRKYTTQILEGLDFLHSKGFAHCDIKGGNILVSEDGVIKLADFNSSKLLEGIAGAGSNPLKSMLGTPQFMAPEVIRQTGHGKKADIWSVGCTVIQMLDGHPPWDSITNKVSLLFHIASSKEPPAYPAHVSALGSQFLDRCFQLDPKERATCKELLRHPWIVAEGEPAQSPSAAHAPSRGDDDVDGGSERSQDRGQGAPSARRDGLAGAGGVAVEEAARPDSTTHSAASVPANVTAATAARPGAAWDLKPRQRLQPTVDSPDYCRGSDFCCHVLWNSKVT